MKKALIIRPDNQQQVLQQKLNDLSLPHLLYSFLTITELPQAGDPVVLAKHWDGIIFVSQNAVDFSHQQMTSYSWPNTRYFAVGPGTAKHAANVIHHAVTCPYSQHNSEGLLRLAELQRTPAQQWLIVRGNGGRNLLGDSLIARGAAVHYWEVYQRQAKAVDGDALYQQWHEVVDTIVVSSAEQLGSFLSRMPRQAISWLQQCRWVVPSARIAALIPSSQSDNIVITGSATETAMLEALQQMDNNP